MISPIKLWVVLFNSLVFISTSFAAETIKFDNFSHQIVLEKKLSTYQVKGTDHLVKLSNRLIVKTQKIIAKEQLYLHPQVTKVTELFRGEKSDYYSIEIKNKKQLAQVLKDFDRMKGFKLVQPDILQLKPQILLTKNKLNHPVDSLGNIKVRAQRKAKKERRRKPKTSTKLDKLSPYLAILDIPSLWPLTKGKGVKIAIIDDGFNLEHVDLQHLSPVFSYDSDSRKLNALPHSPIDGHGTKVAGIIFAAHNQTGIDGVAPEADLIALRQPDTWTSNTLLSFQLAKLAGASIINCSWHSQSLLQPVADAVDELAQHGRDGKGIAVIFAAGNQARKIKPGSSEAAIDSAIVVTANDENFTQLDYSNYGQTVDISTYGKGVKTTLVSGQYGVFAGTSLAAAIVSGLSALLLSEHPDMTLKQLSQQLKLLTKIQ